MSGTAQMAGLTFILICAGATKSKAVDFVLKPAPDYSFLHDAGQADIRQAGQGLGQMLGAAISGKRVTNLVLVVKCDHYSGYRADYSDGSNQVVDLAGNTEKVDRSGLDKLAVLHPEFHWTDVGC